MAEIALRKRIREMRDVAPEDLHDNPKNWRKHPREQRDGLRGLLEGVGIVGALVAYASPRNGGKLTLIDGHLRHEEFRTTWPTLILDLTDEEADTILATYDPLSALAEADKSRLGSLAADAYSGTGSDAIRGFLLAVAKKNGVGAEAVVPGENAQKEPELRSEAYVEIYCTRDALTKMRDTLAEWGKLAHVTINIS